MIDERIVIYAKNFADQWNGLLKDYPRYRLDLSWPSVGTVQAILDPLRRKEELEDRDNELMLGAASYLTLIWHSFWSAYKDQPEVRADLIEEEPIGITLTIRGGKYLPEKQSARIALIAALWKIVRSPEEPFHFFEKTKLSLAPGFDELPLFFAGLLTGLSPFYQGPWAERADIDLIDYIRWAERLMALTCSTHYEMVYPSEPLGKDLGLYEKQLIIPPFAHKQREILTRPVFALLDPQLVSEPSYYQLLWNLGLSMNQSLSLPALVLQIALAESEDIPKLRPLCQGNLDLITALRPALHFARGTRGYPDSPQIAAIVGEFAEAKRQLTLECELDILPWIFLPPEEILQEKYYAFLLALSMGEWLAAAGICEDLSLGRPAFLLQAAMLFDLAGSQDETRRILADLTKSKIPLELLPYHHQLMGVVAANYEVSESLFTEALNLAMDLPKHMRVVLSKQLIGIKLVLGKSAEAVQLIQSIPAEFHDRAILLQEAALLRGGAGEKEAVLKAVRALPNDKRAFWLLVDCLVRDEQVRNPRQIEPEKSS